MRQGFIQSSWLETCYYKLKNMVVCIRNVPIDSCIWIFSPVGVLLKEVKKPLGGRVLLEKVCHRSGFLYIAPFHFLSPSSLSLLPMYGQKYEHMISQMPAPATMLSLTVAVPLPYWWTLALWNCKLKYICFSLCLLSCGYSTYIL